jgi:UDP-N-acetyl-D-mannosaminuronic acid dehydrogenase
MMIREKRMKHVVVVGLGYVGLPTAIVASEAGYNVLGFDIDDAKCNRIKSGDSTIVEPEIKERLSAALLKSHFHVDSSIRPADYFIIAVPTPLDKNSKADLSAVYAAADSVVSVLKRGDTVIIESTVSVGATEKIANFFEQKTGLKVEEDFFVAHCPERVLPGRIFQELVTNDRIIGGIGARSAAYAREFYLAFVSGNMYQTSSQVAEMVKLVENSARDVQIALAHQVADMAEAAGVDPFTVIAFANKHPRVSILSPSAGVGGHCIAVDPWFLVESFPENTELFKTARLINNQRPKNIGAKIDEAAAAIIKEKGSKYTPTVFFVGLTFKPDTDDIRNSPALEIAMRLNENKKVNVLAYDPYLSGDTLTEHGLAFPRSLDQGVTEADIVVFLVKHSAIKFSHGLLEGKEVIDVCGALYNPYQVKPQGSYYAARWSDDGFSKESSLKGIKNRQEKNS